MNDDMISRQRLLKELKHHKELFCRNRIEFLGLSKNDKARADEIDNCYAMVINAPSAQPETHEERTKTHACDCISRQAAIDAVEILLEQTEEDADVKTWNNAIRGAINSIKHHVPSAQQVRTQMSSADDLISRQAAIDAECEVCQIAPKKERGHNCTYYVHGCKEIECLRALPSAQPVGASMHDSSTDYAHGFADGYKNGLKDAQPEPQWIPVSERLPDDLGDYLVSIKRIGWNMEEYVVNDIAYWDDLEGFHKADEVLAWMPLPEPYRAERRTDEADYRKE